MMKQLDQMMPQGLHHMAFRCRDSEETRAFYEDFLGLPLSASFPITSTRTNRPCRALHTFYRLADGSFLAFFEVPDMAFDFKEQHDFDLHVALEVPAVALQAMRHKALSRGMECRGPVNHEFIGSILLRDPNGYVVELAAKRSGHDAAVDPANNGAHDILRNWLSERDAARV